MIESHSNPILGPGRHRLSYRTCLPHLSQVKNTVLEAGALYPPTLAHISKGLLVVIFQSIIPLSDLTAPHEGEGRERYPHETRWEAKGGRGYTLLSL